jgi:uncharacterized protein VirK/YbjX
VSCVKGKGMYIMDFETEVIVKRWRDEKYYLSDYDKIFMDTDGMYHMSACHIRGTYIVCMIDYDGI